MKLSVANASAYLPDTNQENKVSTSRAAQNSNLYSDENNITALHQKNLVDNYFTIFEKDYSDVAIKNLIAARLQPSYQLPTIHDTKALAAKAKELLDFSFTA